MKEHISKNGMMWAIALTVMWFVIWLIVPILMVERTINRQIKATTHQEPQLALVK